MAIELAFAFFADGFVDDQRRDRRTANCFFPLTVIQDW